MTSRLSSDTSSSNPPFALALRSIRKSTLADLMVTSSPPSAGPGRVAAGRVVGRLVCADAPVAISRTAKIAIGKTYLTHTLLSLNELGGGRVVQGDDKPHRSPDLRHPRITHPHYASGVGGRCK